MKKIRRSSLRSHKIKNKELESIFSGLKMSQVYWHKDLLPEFFWIEALVNYYGEERANHYYNEFLDSIEKIFINNSNIYIGIVSDFGDIPEKYRNKIVENNKLLIEDVIYKPFANIIKIYPNIPMKWLLQGFDLSKIDEQDGIKQVVEAIKRLYPAKDNHCGFCRAIPLNRYFKHKKIFLTSNLAETIKAVEQYPLGDRYRVETLARNIINHDILNKINSCMISDKLLWSKDFWCTNYKLTKCDEQ